MNLWISNRNLLCCQWSHKEGNWPSERIRSETTGFGEGPICRDRNNTCWGLYGEFFQLMRGTYVALLANLVIGLAD